MSKRIVCLRHGQTLWNVEQRFQGHSDIQLDETGIAQAAELLGHKGTEMIMRHYNKLRERRQHLRDEITRATRRDGGSGETPRRPPEVAA